MIPLVKPYFPPREELMPALEEILYSGYVATGQPVFDFGVRKHSRVEIDSVESEFLRKRYPGCEMSGAVSVPIDLFAVQYGVISVYI